MVQASRAKAPLCNLKAAALAQQQIAGRYSDILQVIMSVSNLFLVEPTSGNGIAKPF